MKILQFCKALCLASRIRDFKIETMDNLEIVINIGNILLLDEMSSLVKISLPGRSWEDMTILFHRLANRETMKTMKDSRLKEVEIIGVTRFNIRRLAAEVGSVDTVQKLNKTFPRSFNRKMQGLYLYAYCDREANKFWTNKKICGLDINVHW